MAVAAGSSAGPHTVLAPIPRPRTYLILCMISPVDPRQQPTQVGSHAAGSHDSRHVRFRSVRLSASGGDAVAQRVRGRVCRSPHTLKPPPLIRIAVKHHVARGVLRCELAVLGHLEVAQIQVQMLRHELAHVDLPVFNILVEPLVVVVVVVVLVL